MTWREDNEQILLAIGEICANFKDLGHIHSGILYTYIRCTPSSRLIVDEQLFPMTAHCRFMQYTANKSDKFSLKLITLATALNIPRMDLCPRAKQNKLIVFMKDDPIIEDKAVCQATISV